MSTNYLLIVIEINNIGGNFSTQIYLPLCPLFLAPLSPPVVRRDERRPKELTMALRRPPTRIELKADDVEDYDKVRSGLMFAQGSEEGLTIDQRDSQYGQCGGG